MQPVRDRTTWILGATVVVATLLVILLLKPAEFEPPKERERSAEQNAGKIVRSIAPAAERATAIDRRRQLRVVDAATNQPIARARLESAVVGSRSIPNDRVVIEQSGDTGRIPLPTDFAASRVIVRASGYIPTSLSLRDDELTEVPLVRGATQRIRVVTNEGKPIPGCLVVLHDVNSALAYPSTYTKPGFGNPDSIVPVDAATTDAEGIALFDGLRPGEYAVKTVDAEQCPMAARVSVHVPGLTPTLIMTHPHGIVVAAPVAIRHCRFDVPEGSYQKSPCAGVLSKVFRRRLRDQHPGCEAFFVTPNAGQPTPVRVTALLIDGSLAHGEWELVDARSLVEPIYLAITRPPGGGRLLVEVQHEGTTTGGFPLVAMLAEKGSPQIPFAANQPVVLPPGEYTITTPAAMAWFDEALRAVRVRVVDGQDAVARIDLPWLPVCVQVVATTSDGIVDTPMHISLSHERSGISGMSANLQQDDMPATFWCPPGRIVVAAVSAHAERATKSVDLDASTAAPVCMNLVLVRQ